jgi:hypothetical protein
LKGTFVRPNRAEGPTTGCTFRFSFPIGDKGKSRATLHKRAHNGGPRISGVRQKS